MYGLNIIILLLTLGDFSAHGMWTSYAGPQRVLDNIATVSKQMHSRFPKIPIFPMIGNNDLPGHYVLPKAGGDWYQKVLSSWESLIMCSECPGSVKKPTTQAILQESFLEGGYYNASIAGNQCHIKIIANFLLVFIKVRVKITFHKKVQKSLPLRGAVLTLKVLFTPTDLKMWALQVTVAIPRLSLYLYLLILARVKITSSKKEDGECGGWYHYPILMGVVVVRAVVCRTWAFLKLFVWGIHSICQNPQSFLKLERIRIIEKCHLGKCK